MQGRETRKRDKQARIAVQAAKFENGLVYLPERAARLSRPRARALLFPPNSRHDDQIDSVSQALADAARGISMVDYLWLAPDLIDGDPEVIAGEVLAAITP